MTNWNNVEGFEPWEFEDPLLPGSGDEINGETLLLLVGFRTHLVRRKLATGIIVTSAVDLYGAHGHSKASYHLLSKGCRAVDFFLLTQMSKRQQIHEFLKVGFTGAGVYFDWKHKGKPITVGFHGDTRPVNESILWRRNLNRYTYFI